MTYLSLIFVFSAVQPLICASTVTPSSGKVRLWIVARLRDLIRSTFDVTIGNNSNDTKPEILSWRLITCPIVVDTSTDGATALVLFL